MVSYQARNHFIDKEAQTKKILVKSGIFFVIVTPKPLIWYFLFIKYIGGLIL